MPRLMQTQSTKNVPGDRRYLATHEWHKLDGETVTVGLTQFAADELTDVTYVSLPKMGQTIAAGGRFGEVESVKATSDLYCGVAGTVTAANDELSSNPGLINTNPYDKGWIVRVKVAGTGDFDKLLTVEQYIKQIGR
jgi:glycine cleavage system H protein